MGWSKSLLLLGGVFILALFCVENSFADTSTDFVHQIQQQFQTVGATYIAKLKDYAFGLFKLFLLIDVGIFGVKAALNRSEIGETISQFMIALIFAAFCFVAIKYYDSWTAFILEKAQTISTAVGGAAIELSPIDTGFMILTQVNENASIWSPIESLGYYIFACIILVCLALMTARMLVILCESYIAMNAAILLLGFGGASFLRDYAMNTMRYAVSVAFKLFVMRLLIGVGLLFVKNLSDIAQVTYADLAILLSTAVVLLVLVNTLPETVAGIINGSHIGAGVGLGSAAKGVAVAGAVAAGAVAAGAVGAARTASTVSKAHKIASLEGYGSATNGAGQSAGMLARVGERLTGTAHHLGQAYQAARQQDGAAGGIGDTLRRMRTNVKDMHEAQQVMSDPNRAVNPYRNNPFLSGQNQGGQTGLSQTQMAERNLGNQQPAANMPASNTGGNKQMDREASAASRPQNAVEKEALQRQKDNSTGD